MIKKEKLVGTYYMYTVFDTVGKRFHGTFYHTTDEDMVRITLPTILMDYPLRDIEIYKIGIFNDVTGKITSIPHKKINTKCYTFPHSRLSSIGDDVSLEEIEKLAQDTKAKAIISRSENSEKKGVVNE